MPNRPLNRQSFTPLYYQLSEKLKLLIAQQLSPGASIPSENELMERYAVSRNTVRQAIELLVREGFVYRIQGKGTYVTAENNRYQLQKLVSFSEDMRRRGLTPDALLLGLGRVQPFPKIRRELRLGNGDEAFEIRRLRLADESPMALSTAYIPCSLFPELSPETIANSSLFELIAQTTNSTIGYADRIIRSVAADEQQARLLQVKRGAPLTQVEGPTFLQSGLPVEYVITYYRADRYEFTFHAIR